MNKKVILPLLGAILLFSCSQEPTSSEAPKTEITFTDGVSHLEKSLKAMDSNDKLGTTLTIENFKYVSPDYENDVLYFNSIEVSNLVVNAGISGLKTATTASGLKGSASISCEKGSYTKETRGENQAKTSLEFNNIELKTYFDNLKYYVDGSNAEFMRFVNTVGGSITAENSKECIDCTEYFTDVVFPLFTDTKIDDFMLTDSFAQIKALLTSLNLEKYSTAFKMYQQSENYIFEANIDATTLASIITPIYISMSGEKEDTTYTADAVEESSETIDEYTQIYQYILTSIKKVGFEKFNFAITFNDNGFSSFDFETVICPETNENYENFKKGDEYLGLKASIDLLYGDDVKIESLSSYEGFVLVEE